MITEVVYDYNEFKEKLDYAKPIHHEAYQKPLDKNLIMHELTFRIYGISKNNGHILAFEIKERHSVLDIPLKSHNALKDIKDFLYDRYLKLVEEYAKPLGSTEGRWEAKKK
jgi:hypothetical protein